MKIIKLLLFISFIIISPTFTAYSEPTTQNNPFILTLDKAIKLALENNNNIIIAEKEVNKSKYAANQAKSMLFPDISLNANYSYLNKLSSFNIGGVSVSTGKNNTYGSQISIKLPLFTGGKIINSIQAANLYKDISIISLEGLIRDIKCETTKAFYNCLLLKESIELNQEIITRLEEYCKSLKIRFEKGIVPQIELLKAEADLENAKPELEKSKANLIIAVMNLKRIINTQDNFKIEGSLKYIPYVKESKEILEKNTFNYYPPLCQLKKTIEISRKKINIAKSGHLPSVYLNSNYTIKVSDGSFSFSGPEDSWNVTALFELPLFKGFKTVNEVKEAMVSLEQNQKQYNETKFLVSIQFEDAWNTFEVSDKFVKAKKMNFDNALKYYNIIQKRFAYGLESNLDLIDAGLALKQAKLVYSKSAYDFTIAKANLEKISGIYLKPLH